MLKKKKKRNTRQIAIGYAGKKKKKRGNIQTKYIDLNCCHQCRQAASLPCHYLY